MYEFYPINIRKETLGGTSDHQSGMDDVFPAQLRCRYYWRLFSLFHLAEGDQDPMLRFHQFGAADCGHLFLGSFDSSSEIANFLAGDVSLLVNASNIPGQWLMSILRPCHPYHPWLIIESQDIFSIAMTCPRRAGSSMLWVSCGVLLWDAWILLPNLDDWGVDVGCTRLAMLKATISNVGPMWDGGTL